MGFSRRFAKYELCDDVVSTNLCMMVEKAWSTYNNQPTAQFYRVTTDNSFHIDLCCATRHLMRIDHRSVKILLVMVNLGRKLAGGGISLIAVDLR